jgi:hypothetical protein
MARPTIHQMDDSALMGYARFLERQEHVQLDMIELLTIRIAGDETLLTSYVRGQKQYGLTVRRRDATKDALRVERERLALMVANKESVYRELGKRGYTWDEIQRGQT